MLQHDNRIRVVVSGFHQTLHVGRIGGVRDLNTFYRQQGAFHRTAVIRSTATISADRYTKYHRHRKLTHGEIATLGQLGNQLIQSGIDIIGKLNFNDRPYPNSCHASGRTDDIGFLDGCIENPMIPELITEGSCFSKNPTQSLAYILSIQNSFRVFLHQFTDRE